MKTYIFLALFVMFGSCSKISPGGFWTEFRNTEIVSKRYNHGPWGGTTEIHWKKKANSQAFTKKEIIKHAQNHGWIYVNEFESTEEYDFSNVIFEHEFSNITVANNSILLRFKTDLYTIQEDEGLQTMINCFAVLDPKRSTLIIYHRWGDF